MLVKCYTRVIKWEIGYPTESCTQHPEPLVLLSMKLTHQISRVSGGDETAIVWCKACWRNNETRTMRALYHQYLYQILIWIKQTLYCSCQQYASSYWTIYQINEWLSLWKCPTFSTETSLAPTPGLDLGQLACRDTGENKEWTAWPFQNCEILTLEGQIVYVKLWNFPL